MARNNLEQRVTQLERQVASLQKALANGSHRDWRSTIGMFSGDEVMKRIDEAALLYREKDREKARKKPARTHRG